MMQYNIIFMTTPSKEEASKIIHILLKEHLIACANVIESISSYYWWHGKIEEAKEVLVIMKSNESLFPKIVKKVMEIHSYDIPEILALPINNSSQSYFDWMKKCLELRKFDE